MKKKGFTLIELLVVIAILAILATVSIIGYSSFIGRANESNCLTEATQIRELFIAEDINNDNMKFNNDGSIELTGDEVTGSSIDDYTGGKYVTKNDGAGTLNVLTGNPGDGKKIFEKYTLENIIGNEGALKNDINLGNAKLELVKDVNGTSYGDNDIAYKGFLKYTSKDGDYSAIIKFDNSAITVKGPND